MSDGANSVDCMQCDTHGAVNGFCSQECRDAVIVRLALWLQMLPPCRQSRCYMGMVSSIQTVKDPEGIAERRLHMTVSMGFCPDCKGTGRDLS